jgi:hypothetical protein
LASKHFVGSKNGHVYGDDLKQAVLNITDGEAEDWVAEHLSKKAGKAQIRHTNEHHESSVQAANPNYWGPR